MNVQDFCCQEQMNKNMRKISMKIVIPLLALVSLGSLYFLVKVPTVEGIRSFSVDSLDQNTYWGRAEVIVKNENSVSVTSRDLKFTLTYMDKLIAKGFSEGAIEFKKKQENIAPLRFALYLDSLSDDVEKILEGDSVRLKANIEGSFTTFQFKMRFEDSVFLRTASITEGLVQQAFKGKGVKLTNPRVGKINLDYTDLKLDLLIHNNFPTNVGITGVKLSLYSDEEKEERVSKWESTDSIFIEKYSDTSIVAAWEIDNLKMGASIFSKLLTRKLEFYMAGTLSLLINDRSMKIPVKSRLMINPLSGEVTIID